MPLPLMSISPLSWKWKDIVGSWDRPGPFCNSCLKSSLTCIFPASPCDSIRLAVLTASPHISYANLFSPIIPATTAPVCKPNRTDTLPREFHTAIFSVVLCCFFSPPTGFHRGREQSFTQLYFVLLCEKRCETLWEPLLFSHSYTLWYSVKNSVQPCGNLFSSFGVTLYHMTTDTITKKW